jgi:hypothetical protein
MQARSYRPDVGRFLTEDHYESALRDFQLQADPLTQNRFAFAGGNPVSRVEWDGHCVTPDACMRSDDPRGSHRRTMRDMYGKGNRYEARRSGASGRSNVRLAQRVADEYGAVGMHRQTLVRALSQDPSYARQLLALDDEDRQAMVQEGVAFLGAQAEAEAAADLPQGGWLDRLGGAYCESIGACFGDPQTQAYRSGGRAAETVDKASALLGAAALTRELLRQGLKRGAKWVVGGGGVARGGDDALRALPRGTPTLTQQRLEHIAARHWPTSGAKRAGKFAPGTTGRDLKSMINEAAERGAILPNTRGRPGNIFEHGFGRPIGTSRSGASTSTLRVVVRPDGRVHTAFPYSP